MPPLDGSRVLAGLSWKARELYERPEAAMYGLVIMLVLLMPISGSLFGWVWSTVDSSAVDLANALP